MVKDRTAEFKKRCGLKCEKESLDKDVGEDTAIVIISTPDSMDNFMQKIDNITSKIEQMELLVKEIKNKHDQILFKDDSKAKKLLEDNDINFKMLAKQCKENINLIEAECSKLDPNSATCRMKRIQLEMLRKRLWNCIEDYSLAQDKYSNKSKDIIRRQIEITNPDLTNEEIDEKLDNPNSEIFIQGLLTETREAKEQLDEIKQRHAHILKIEKSLKELHDMFTQMAILVQQQGESIDRIETQVGNTLDFVEKGREQTKQAMEYQTKARKCKIYIAIILIVVLLLIVWASFY